VSALALTYHAVERGPSPLCVDPKRFADQLDLIVETGVRTVTVSELAAALRNGRIAERTLALTFDDGAASVARTAAPLLLERGLVATVFCVAGHLGGRRNIQTKPAWAARIDLAAADELATLARLGFEIGSHGMEHVPLTAATPESVLRRELHDSRRTLEEALGVEVGSFAYPYNVRSGDARRAAVEAGYRAACAGSLALVGRAADPLAIPRVDAYYLEWPPLFRMALAGSPQWYLAIRRAGAAARRLLRKDYVPRSRR